MATTLFRLNETQFIVADCSLSKWSTLVLLSDGTERSRALVHGQVTGAAIFGEEIFCLSQDELELRLYHFTEDLKEKSSEQVVDYYDFTEDLDSFGPWKFVSTISEHAVYFLCHHNDASRFFPIVVNGKSKVVHYDVPADLLFTKIDIQSGAQHEWKMDFFPDEELYRCVTDFDRLYDSEDGLRLEYSGSGTDLPPDAIKKDISIEEFDEIFLPFTETAKVDFDAQEIKW